MPTKNLRLSKKNCTYCGLMRPFRTTSTWCFKIPFPSWLKKVGPSPQSTHTIEMLYAKILLPSTFQNRGGFRPTLELVHLRPKV